MFRFGVVAYNGKHMADWFDNRVAGLQIINDEGRQNGYPDVVFFRSQMDAEGAAERLAATYSGVKFCVFQINTGFESQPQAPRGFVVNEKGVLPR